MKNYLSSLIPHLSFRKGFTLIELMVVISITAVLGTLGIAGFNNYNKVQVLQTSASEVITMLNLAKSRAQSQIKPSTCPNSLNGYWVVISAPTTYTLKVSCSGLPDSINDLTVGNPKHLPTSLSFSVSTSFFFPVQTGGVQASGQFNISGYGRSKTISVNSLGGVSTEPLPTATPTSVPPTPTPTPLPGPIGWWKMDGNATDSSGNGNNGTVSGATLTTDRYGQAEKAYSFDGTSGYISFGNILSSVFAGSSAKFTLSAWVQKPTASTGRMILVKNDSSIDQRQFWWEVSNTTGLSTLLLFGSLGSGGDYLSITGSTNILGSDFHHLVVVIDLTLSGNDRFKLYVDGIRETETFASGGGGFDGAMENGTACLAVGVRGACGSKDAYFNGKIDDVRIYSRALSAGEVVALYTSP